MTIENETRDQKYLPTDEKILLRNSWLKIGVISTIAAVLVVKIYQADLSKMFSEFNFSDLLSLCLAIFAIGLSVLFYLKATETSNVFYDNTYRFTKDVSEILGRVEAGFGERLRHLDEGYTGLKSAVEKLPLDKAKAEEEIKEEEEQVQRAEKERSEIFEQLFERAKLQDNEKNEILDKLKEKDNELINAKRELLFLKRRLFEAEEVDENFTRRMPHHIRYKLYNTVVPMLSKYISHGASKSIIKRRFNTLSNNLPTNFIEELKEFEIVDSDGNITQMGIELLRSISREYA